MMTSALGEGTAPDPIKAFSNIVAKKIGSKNDSRTEGILTMISTFAILEFGQNVLNIGSGFTKMDLSGLTIAQIKQTVKKIEESVDKLLQAPLKNAKTYFDSALSKVSNECSDDAYDNFHKVIEQATNAYNLLETKNLPIKDFSSCRLT